MWQIAYGNVKCKSIVDPAARKACYTSAPKIPPYADIVTAEDKDQLWQTFRSLFMAEREQQVNKHITANTPVVPSQDLVIQKYILHFPESINQLAQQFNTNGDWNWLPANPNMPPNVPQVIPGDPNTDPYASKCQSYIESWKQALLQCPAIANHASKNLILTQITDGMKEVCLKGSNPANPNGSSNVAPETPQDGKPRSFEEIINAVLTQYAIAKTDFCNAFVIEFPKPYGKGPKFVNEVTTAVDTCNCNQYAKLKTEAQVKGFNPMLLSSLNQYLKNQYGDTITVALFNGLQHCNELKDGCPAKATCISLQPGPVDGHDTFFDNDDIIVNNSDSGYLMTKAYGNGGVTSRSLLKFNLSGIPVDATILSAKLSLYADPTLVYEQSAMMGDNASYLQRVTSNWLSQTVNWNIQPATTTQNQVLLPTSNDAYQNYLNTDVISLVKDMVTNINYGFMIRHVNENVGYKAMKFASSNHGKPLLRPKLEVCYKVCNGEKVLYYPLPKPAPLPEFLKCGFTGNAACKSCAELSALTAEFKTVLPAPYNAAPIFAGVNLTTDQMVKNSSYARFINYRTGMQYSWMEYAKAAAASMPTCNLANYAANAGALQNVICGDAKPLTDTVGLYKKDPPCQQVYNMSVSLGEQVYEKQKETLLGTLEGQYRTKCLAAKAIEKFSVTYTNKEYHYTLYYYDQAGNLVKTVPPKGARPDFSVAFTGSVKTARTNGQIVVPPHILATNYRYNSLGQVAAQHTPDAGQSNFWYDKLGRLAVSQNSQQMLDKKYSYTLYDSIGRTKEVGQLTQAVAMTQIIAQNPNSLNGWLNDKPAEQITRTFYDKTYFYGEDLLCPGLLCQKNLRNRVSFTGVYATGKPGIATAGTHDAATYFSYDIAGGADTLLQDYNSGVMKAGNNRFKKIAYDYDLISGKVNKVSYQPGQPDAFYHKYFYDAENRLTDVYTSKDALTFERDSRYDYYKHGPLARNIIGQNQVQGFDYAYTIQGWLKGMNSTAVGDGKFDMGGDGTGANAQVAKDAFGFALHYFSTANAKDYKPIGGGQPFANAAAAGFGFVPLYNGNIAGISMNIPTLGDALLETFRYDQLQRLTKVNTYKGLNPATNNWNVVSIDDYREELSYDPNGNIQTYKRNGSGNNLNLNNYSYTYQANTNRLISLKNSVDNKITAYGYDAIGNVIKDEKQNVVNNTWNVYGKLQKVEKKDGKIITYSYDAAGNRISKTVGDTTEIYVRDATGNVLLTYQKNPIINSGHVSTKEFYKYGSNLLGIKKKAIDMQVIVPNTGIQTFVRGEDEYYVYGHNGNIIGSVSDKKIQHDDNNDKIVDYYTADVRTATMFSSFGAMSKSFNGDSLDFAFNGQKRSKEISATAQTAQFWEYDGDVGRRWNLDVKPNISISPYAAFENNPIWRSDPLGDSVIDDIPVPKDAPKTSKGLQTVKATSAFKTLVSNIDQNNSNATDSKNTNIVLTTRTEATGGYGLTTGYILGNDNEKYYFTATDIKGAKYLSKQSDDFLKTNFDKNSKVGFSIGVNPGYYEKTHEYTAAVVWGHELFVHTERLLGAVQSLRNGGISDFKSALSKSGNPIKDHIMVYNGYKTNMIKMVNEIGVKLKSQSPVQAALFKQKFIKTGLGEYKNECNDSPKSCNDVPERKDPNSYLSF
jgi:YD repeat-containing protein